MLTALGTGIVGMATEGYVPKTGTDAPLRMLDRINEWEKLYDSQNREYRQLKLRALMGQQEGEQQAANMEASAAGQAYNLAQKQYDALLGYMWKAQQEKQKRAEDLRDKKEIEKIRGENNLKGARTRAAASASTASARAAAAAGRRRGREEIVHRELHRIEDLARVLAAAVAAGKRALVGRNAVVVHGDEKLRVAL